MTHTYIYTHMQNIYTMYPHTHWMHAHTHTHTLSLSHTHTHTRTPTSVSSSSPEQTVLESDDSAKLLLDSSHCFHSMRAQVELVLVLVLLQKN